MDKLERLKKVEKSRDLLTELAEDLSRQIEDEKPKEWSQEDYWWICDTGGANKASYLPANAGLLHVFRCRKAIGNTFPSKEAAEREVAIRKAIQHINEWRGYKDEDWVDWWKGTQTKYRLAFNHSLNKFEDTCGGCTQAIAPGGYFKTIDDCDRCIKECAPQLRVIFGVGEEKG